jgi:uncharacterized lipoprotein YmbA
LARKEKEVGEMTNSPFPLTLGIGLLICLLFIGACSSSAPARHYVLSPGVQAEKIPREESCPSIGVGPVNLPEYVNRQSIVTRTAPNELGLSYFDLWAEPLADSVPRMIAENLSRLLCVREIVLFPWKPSRLPQYRVELEVLQMDGTLGGALSLEAWWSVTYGGDKKARITRKAAYSEPVSGRDYDALVQAHSRALAAVSRDIAAVLGQLQSAER